MKTHVVLIIFILCQLHCIAQSSLNTTQRSIYKKRESSVKLELNSDGTYILYNPRGNNHLAIEQCNYSSKGKWKQISDDVLEITSENYYQKQDGFKYEIKKENKLSQDSLYINVSLPDSLIYYKNGIPVNFSFTFNNDVSKSIRTTENLIRIPKKKYLWPKKLNTPITNHIIFSINANVSGTVLYKSRILFEIFEEDIDTEKNNYLSILLPYFDLCFFDFEPYSQELIFNKNSKELMWKGEVWEKQLNKSK